jgi:hypothetical protein
MNFLMPTLRRAHADPGPARETPLRSSLADAAWAVEDRVVLGAAAVFHRLVEVVRWPFERIVWGAENWLVWPIREEAELWSRPARYGALAMTLVLAAAGLAAGIVVSDPSSGGGPSTVAVEPAATRTTPAPTPAAKKPVQPRSVLHGATPTFAPEHGGGVPKSEVGSLPAPGSVAAEADAAASPTGSSSGSSASEGPEVAGPAAIKVAREFAGAFVLYETGHEGADVKAVFAKTATPDLAQALLERPPRLPGNVNVPQAKVLNVVVGPRQGDTYSLSVSLLRVGVTSELRLEMRKGPGSGAGEGEESKWRVTDVLG